ncbi:DUF4194 domain-containing protein [Calderihabitans maritimus]|uniref:DUF4194 domain-containing protein n=1 Tax=Calderihabitans maritimus TaxID=1246530 RepID=A0A1Z5HUL4_9FIRM|nr:DUF4194 domain-containing protein [Calderihabitans maritimus]GAW93202.1 hypothetical protein Desgi_3813 [Calderihabitans maritimus]
MSWYQQYEEFTNKEKETFREAANLLLRQTFLVSEREADRPYYRFVERYLEVFTGYFLLSGWDLMHIKRLAVIQLYNRYEKNRYNFTLQETIFLFILRLLYEEKQRDLRLTQQVLVSGRDIQEKYMALQIRNRLPAQEDMQRILRLFNRFSLLDLKRGHWKETDAVYVLYPSLTLVLDITGMENLAQWIAEQGVKEGLEDEISDQD